MEKKKIFIVEDESIVSLDIQTRVKRLGYSVAGTASSGEEAIRKISDSQPDLILMDIRIKGEIDGIETAAEVKKIYDVPIIFLTAYADQVTLERAKITDPFGYLIKPFEERELHINIEIALYKAHTQKLIREKDKWLSAILKSIGDGVIATDNKGNIRFINDIALRLTGYTLNEAIGNELDLILKIRSEITGKPIDNIFHRVIQTGELIGLANHTELIDKNGNVYPIADAGTPIKDAAGNINGVVVVIHDMSYYKKAEELIKIQTVALNSAYNGIIISDKDGAIVYANESMQKLTGFTKNEILGNNVNIFKSNLHKKEFFDEMWKTISDGKIWKGEIQNRKKNGDPYFEEMSITPLKNDNGSITHFIAIKEDITIRKNQEIELIRAKEEAEKSDKLKSEFLAQMSHEIRTPINIISNFMQIYEDELNAILPPELKKSMSAVKTESHRIVSTIDSIVNMAQLKAGTFRVKLQKLDLFESVIKPHIDQWYFLAENKNLDLLISGKPNNVFVNADSYSLGQAVNHIVDNALKYTDTGKVEIKFEMDSGKIKIIVTDTGFGISDKYLPYIFEPFSQEHQGYDRKYEGNGLGLALTKQYCEINNATISIKSKKGVGTCVEISLAIE